MRIANCLIGGLISFVIFGVVSAAPPEAFEVASIRPNPGPWHVLNDFKSSGPRLTLEGYNLFGLVTEAYNLKFYQVIIAKSIPRNLAFGTRYNVLAKAKGDRPRTKQEFRQMLQNLLMQRCGLKVRRAKKEMRVYALVVDKNGPKFKNSAPDDNQVSHFGANGHNQTFSLHKATMGSLADDIQVSFGVDRPVIDRTGLTGEYTIKFEATPESIGGGPQPDDRNVFTAVREQLGLKLEPQKAEIAILVVDRITKPSGN